MNSRNHKKVPNSVCSVNFPFQSVPGSPGCLFLYPTVFMDGKVHRNAPHSGPKEFLSPYVKENILLIPGS